MPLHGKMLAVWSTKFVRGLDEMHTSIEPLTWWAGIHGTQVKVIQ